MEAQTQEEVALREELARQRSISSRYIHRDIRALTPNERAEMYRAMNESARIERELNRLYRPSFVQRISTFLRRRTTAPIAPAEVQYQSVEAEAQPTEEIQMARFMD